MRNHRVTTACSLIAASTLCGLFGACSSSTDTVPTSEDGGPIDATSGADVSVDAPAHVDSAPLPDASPDASAAPDADAGMDAGFVVSTVPGVVLWLDANKGVTEASGHVIGWTDQTTNHNDALASGVDAGDAGLASQPYKMPALVNGLAAIRFGLSPGDTDGGFILDGGVHTPVTSYLTVADSTSLQFDVGDFLVETVIRVDHNAFGAVFEKQLVGSPFAGVGMFVNFGAPTYGAQIDGNHTLIGSLMNDIGTWRVYGIARHGSVLTVRINGAVQTQTDFNDAGADDAAAAINCSAVGRDMTIGAQIKGNASLFDLGADLAEMIAVKGAIGSSDLASIEQYLMTKYGIH